MSTFACRLKILSSLSGNGELDKHVAPHLAAAGLHSFHHTLLAVRMRVLRRLSLTLLVLIAVINGWNAPHAPADEVKKIGITPATPNQPVSFHDRLVVGLEARLKSEIKFVDAVVLEVQAGHLPQDQVDQTFFWARQRAAAAVARDHRNYRPITYFQPAMRARANLLHVTLPPSTP